MIKIEMDEKLFEKYILNNEDLIDRITYCKDRKGKVLKIIIY